MFKPYLKEPDLLVKTYINFRSFLNSTIIKNSPFLFYLLHHLDTINNTRTESQRQRNISGKILIMIRSEQNLPFNHQASNFVKMRYENSMGTGSVFNTSSRLLITVKVTRSRIIATFLAVPNYQQAFHVYRVNMKRCGASALLLFCCY